MSVTFDYAAGARTALRLLRKFGQDVRVRRRISSTYNPATSKASVGGVEETGKGALLDYTPDVIQNSGGAIRQEDRRLLLAISGLGAAPAPADQAVAGNKIYDIVRVNELAPAGTPVLYDCQVRR